MPHKFDFPNLDAFYRLRTSTPYTLLDTKQLSDKLPLFYDEDVISGSGISSVFQANKASTRISCSANTAGHGARQTKQWGNYQPGKAQLILFTFGNLKSSSGITKRVGYFWDNWGIFLQHKDGVASWGIRTSNTGSPVDTLAPQSSWSRNKMDGSHICDKINLDFTKTQIGFISFEWLGVGSVFCGFYVDGVPYISHIFQNANVQTEVYMSNPNAPVRYELINDGTGGADYLDHICSTIMSEGGQEQTAIGSYVSRDGTPITLANQDIFTPVLSIRLKSNYRWARVIPQDISILMTTNVNYEWALFINPTLAGIDTASWQNVDMSSLQYDISRTATNAVSGGFKIAGGYGSSSAQVRSPSQGQTASFLTIGSNIDGTMDEFVLGVKNIDANGGTCYAGIHMSEYE